MNADLFRDYVQFIADRRLERIGLPTQYGSSNPFPWMSETIDLSKKNFFETQVTEYQSINAELGLIRVRCRVFGGDGRWIVAMKAIDFGRKRIM